MHKDILKSLVLHYLDTETALNVACCSKRIYFMFTENEMKNLRKQRARLSIKRLQEEKYQSMFDKLCNGKMNLSIDEINRRSHASGNKNYFQYYSKTQRAYENNKMMRCPGCNNHVHKKGYTRHVKRGKCYLSSSSNPCKECDIRFTGSQRSTYFLCNHKNICPMDEKVLFSCSNITELNNLGFIDIKRYNCWDQGSTTYRLNDIANLNNVDINEGKGCKFIGTLYEVRRHLRNCKFHCKICDLTDVGDHSKHLYLHNSMLTYYNKIIYEKELIMNCHYKFLGCTDTYNCEKYSQKIRDGFSCRENEYTCPKCNQNLGKFWHYQRFQNHIC